MVHYEIRIEGVLDEQWSDWFEGLEVTPTLDGETVISGHLADQAALHGVLNRIGDLGIAITQVRRIEPPEPG